MDQQDTPKIKQPPVLYTKTQAVIGKITELLGGPLIAYWHNHRGSVCHNDVIAFLGKAFYLNCWSKIWGVS